MKRKNNSFLADWVKKQGSSQRSIAFNLGILPGTLKLWLYQGYVPKCRITAASEHTGIAEEKLIAEYIKRRS